MLEKLRRRLRNEKGFTLIELLAVVAIIAVLAALAVPKVYGAITTSKTKSARADISTIAAALDQYYMDNNQYPQQLNDLVKNGYMKQTTNFLNPFGRKYFYAVNNNGTATAYILADPGQIPDSVNRLYRCQFDNTSSSQSGCGTAPTSTSAPTRTAPEGVAPATQAPLISTILFYDNSVTSFNASSASSTSVSDPSTWFSGYRTDIVTQ